jgi:DNA-binding response OmpR family regulator
MRRANGVGSIYADALGHLNSDASVLLCSGWSKDQYLTMAVESGARGYLTKPFAPEELLREVTRLL